MPNYWFDHIHLMSSDPLSTAEFYEKMFGARQVSTHKTGDGRATVNLNLNGTTILITQPQGDSSRAGLDHFGVRTDDLLAAAEELKAIGVNFTQDVTEVRPGFKISFLKAPEDVAIELQEGSL
ncbi:VOC family protein [Chloroflexota bacterium]